MHNISCVHFISVMSSTYQHQVYNLACQVKIWSFLSCIYYNSLLIGISESHLHQLQIDPNALFRTITQAIE